MLASEPRFYAAPDDWPLAGGGKWWAVYDTVTREKMNVKGYGERPVYGSERLAQKAADKLNKDWAAGKIEVVAEGKSNPYGEPEFRKSRGGRWSGVAGIPKGSKYVLEMAVYEDPERGTIQKSSGMARGFTDLDEAIRAGFDYTDRSTNFFAMVRDMKGKQLWESNAFAWLHREGSHAA
jgi:hypothetical protein